VLLDGLVLARQTEAEEEEQPQPKAATTTTTTLPPTPQQQQEEQLSTSLRQIYVTTWSLLCFLGMVAVALIFLVLQPSTMDLTLASSSMGRMSSVAAAATAEQSLASVMSNEMAMLLTFVYAACAWTVSNGLVLNPRINNLPASCCYNSRSETRNSMTCVQKN
jgi:preprotein translocase subunit SecG